MLIDSEAAGLTRQFAMGSVLSPPLLSITDANGNEGGTIVFSLALSLPADVSVDYAILSGGATVGSDLAAQSGTVAFTGGKVTATIEVPVWADSQLEGDESFFVQLSNVRGAILQRSQATGLITELPVLSVGDCSGEAGGYCSFPINLSRPGDADIMVDYTVLPGTAEPNRDYVPQTGSVTVPAGQRDASVTVRLLPDDSIQPAETFRVSLSNPRGAALGRAEALATIERTATLKIADTVAYWPDHRMQFVLTASKEGSYSSGSISVDYAVVEGTAVAGRDFVPQSGRVTFERGLSAFIDVPLLSNSASAVGKTIVAKLSNSRGAILQRAQAQGAITDTLPTVSIFDDAQFPGETFQVRVAVSYSRPAPQPMELQISVSAVTADGTAIAGVDYAPVTNRLYFGSYFDVPGATEQFVQVNPISATPGSGIGKSFSVILGNATNLTILRGQATCTVLDPRASIQLLVSTEDSVPTLEWKAPADNSWWLEMRSGMEPWHIWMDVPGWKGVGGVNRYVIPISTNPAAFYRLHRIE